MVIFSNCKINLGLNIVSKRADGYHNIETFFYPVPLYDVIEIIPSQDFNFTTSGLSINGATNDNLCVRAYQLLKAHYPNIPNIHLHLHKNIPMGAGIGGGSANAAYTLSLLNKKFSLDLSIETLKNFAVQLGSDCPFFIENKPSFASGRGEVLVQMPISLSNYKIVLLFSNVHISTAEAFAQITPKIPTRSIREIIQLPVEEWKNNLVNDFELSVFPIYPILKEWKERLYKIGACYASMSGSGSTIYGLFPKEINIEEIIFTEFGNNYKILDGNTNSDLYGLCFPIGLIRNIIQIIKPQ